MSNSIIQESNRSQRTRMLGMQHESSKKNTCTVSWDHDQIQLWVMMVRLSDTKIKGCSVIVFLIQSR